MTRYRVEMARAVQDLITHLPPELKRKVKATLRSIFCLNVVPTRSISGDQVDLIHFEQLSQGLHFYSNYTAQ